jgi:hypothetical protein
MIGDVIGSWQLISINKIKEKIDKNGKVRRRNYWLVRCVNCKIYRVMERYNLKPPAGGRCQNCFDRPQGDAGLVQLYGNYTRNSSSRKREFKLKLDQFKLLTSGNCHYCNGPPCLILRGGRVAKSKWGDYIYNGIDRIDNSQGYINSNCVTCCKICNRAKNNLSYDVFMSYINRIKQRS